MYLKFLHVFSWLDSSFLFNPESYSIFWMYHCLFIHSLTKLLPNFDIMDKVSINIQKIKIKRKRLWHWERLKAGGEGDDRGWDGWRASPTQRCEFQKAPGDGEGQGSLACFSPWGHKESDATEQLNWKKNMYKSYIRKNMKLWWKTSKKN